MKQFLFLLSALFLLGSVFATPGITVSSVAVSDSVIHAGDSGSISFIVTNTGDRALTTITINLDSSLSVSPDSFFFQDFDIGESRYVSSVYRAASNTASGAYNIAINADFNVGGTEYVDSNGAVVTVMPVNYLVVDSYTSSISINDDNVFTISVTNEGSDNLENVFLNLVLPNGFIPISGSQFYYSLIRPGETINSSASIFVEKEIEPKAYQFSLVKTAKDYSSSDVLNVIVRGTPNLAFSGINLDPNIPVSGTEQTISVQIENIGSGKAYNVIAQLLLDSGTRGTKIEYLGSIDREDLTSAIFDLQLGVFSSINGEVVVTYNDESGVGHEIRQGLEYEVLAAPVDNTSLLLILAVLGVAGYFGYKYYVKNKKK
jgi:uncharacterized repeat protein (TIGR01451 family)